MAICSQQSLSGGFVIPWLFVRQHAIAKEVMGLTKLKGLKTGTFLVGRSLIDFFNLQFKGKISVEWKELLHPESLLKGGPILRKWRIESSLNIRRYVGVFEWKREFLPSVPRQ